MRKSRCRRYFMKLSTPNTDMKVSQVECRKRKLRCDRLLPCSQCQKSQRACRYAADGDPANLSEGSDVESPLKASKRGCASAMPGTNARNPDPMSLSQTNTAVLEDHGARLERLERMLLANNGYGSPDASMQQQRPSTELLTIRGLTVREGVRTRFFGQMSTRVLLNLVSRFCTGAISGARAH